VCQKVWKLITFTEERQFNMALPLWAIRKYTNGWNDSKDGGRMLTITVPCSHWVKFRDPPAYQGQWKDKIYEAEYKNTVHRSRVDPCEVHTSLMQCGESTKHSGGRKTSYWSAIRRRSDSRPNCKHRRVWILESIVTALFISFFEGRMFSRWIVTNITSVRETLHYRKTHIICDQLVICGLQYYIRVSAHEFILEQ
jgi:hypothetical protein